MVVERGVRVAHPGDVALAVAVLHHSAQTPSSLPAGSRKWKRRPPGNSKIGTVITPPFGLDAGQGVLEVVGLEDDERHRALPTCSPR